MTAAENERKYFTGHLGVKGNGIAFVSADMTEAECFLRENPDAEIVEGEGKVILPGLVNLHTHSAMTLLRSYANGMQLMEWLTKYIWPFEAQMTAKDVAIGARLAVAEMLLGGTTSFADMYWHADVLADVISDSGIRGAAGNSFTVMNDGFLTIHRALMERYGHGECLRVIPMLAPHAPYTVSAEDFGRCIKLSEESGLPIHVHLSETIGEVEDMRRKCGKSPVEYLDSLGVLGGNCIAAHCVHVDDRDMEILSARGVSVAHNPQSNMMLSSGISPVKRMLHAGVNVGLGTDGASSNNDLDMWDEMRTAALLSKVNPDGTLGTLTAYEVLRMATVAGAGALGMGGRLGCLKKGMLADLIVVDMRKPHLQPVHDVVANLVFCASGADVDMVMVDGRMLVRDHRLLSLNADECILEANEAVARLLRKVAAAK